MKLDWLTLGLIVVALVVTLAVYPQLPERIPQHWDFQGEVDAWGSRASVFGTLIITAAVYALLALLPLADRGGRLRAQWNLYNWILRGVVLLLLAIHFSVVAAALGYGVRIAQVAGVMGGLLLAAAGLCLPRLEPNYIAGIRTPWTLRDETTWRITHGVGGVLFTIAGAVLAILSLLLSDLWIFISLMLIMLGLLVWSLVFSARVYRLRR